MSGDCDTCANNFGAWCAGEACADGDGYMPYPPERVRCPYCGGLLSEIRRQGKRKLRHCGSCHMEFEVQGAEPATPEECFHEMA